MVQKNKNTTRKPSGPRDRLLRAVKKQINSRDGQGVKDLRSAIDMLAYLNWFVWDNSRLNPVPQFLNAIQADIVAALYAAAIGFERSAYLHARSLLENIVRHFYFESRPSLLVARFLAPEEGIRDQWADLLLDVKCLPHFAPAFEKDQESLIFSELQKSHAQASRFIHGPTIRYRSHYSGIGSISIEASHIKELGVFLQGVGESCFSLLVLYHLGHYLLAPQPIRRYALSAMRLDARERLFGTFERVSLGWAVHQRKAVLEIISKKRPKRAHDPAGFAIDRDGRVQIVSPSTSGVVVPFSGSRTRPLVHSSPSE